MEKTISPNPASATLAAKRRLALSIITAVAGSTSAVGFTGYLTMQLQLSEIHAVLGFDSRAVGVPGDWLPYVWRLSLVLLALAAVLAFDYSFRARPLAS